MAHLFQVGVGSGGMPVLDTLARATQLTHVTLLDPDVYQAHNVVRHLFPLSAVGELKVTLAERWLRERRPELHIQAWPYDLLAADKQADIESALQSADVGVCAVDNEPAKFYFADLMRRHRKCWTLGEVLSGGIGGFVHWFKPDGPCYGCVASHLQREVTVEKPATPDYNQPQGELASTTVPASLASVRAITGLHAHVTLDLLAKQTDYNPGFTSYLFPLQKVPDVFTEPYRPYRLSIARSESCLCCRAEQASQPSTAEDVDVALDQALMRLGHG